MLRAEQKLSSKKDFLDLYRARNVYYSKNFLVKYLVNNRPFVRFAIIISKKILAKATDRNRVKRKIRAILSKSINSSFAVNIDVMLILKKTALTEPSQVLEKEWQTFMNKRSKYK